MRTNLSFLPNAITAGRILIAPVALWAAWSGNGALYKGLFAAAVLSDFLDGTLARTLKTASDLGARLDTFADILTYLVLFFAVSWLWPEFIHERMWLLAGGFTLYPAGYAVGFLRFGRLNAFHTWAGKLTAVLMPAGLLLWFVGGPAWAFTAALSFSLLSGVEQIVIASVIPRSRTGVPTVWHAWRSRRDDRAACVSREP